MILLNRNCWWWFRLCSVVLLCFVVNIIHANQDTLKGQDKLPVARIAISEDAYMDVNFYLQWWNVVSLDYAGQDLSPRYDVFVRRGRLGVSGKLNPQLFYAFSFAYDGVGKDSLTAAAGIPNQEDNTTFFPRDIFFCYQLHPLLNITVGYFRPKAGKESIYSSSFNISQEKSWASFQPRIHLVGRGIGRETGVNIGGLMIKKRGGLLYDFGIFDPNHPSIMGDRSVWSPLLTGRVVAFIGDPEYTAYPMAYVQSGYGKRKGLSVGANIGYQSKTQLFKNNMLTGVDAQLNYNKVDMLMEYNWLYRSTFLQNEVFTTRDEFLTLKVAYNVVLENRTIVQPTVMYSTENPESRLIPFVNEYTGSIKQFVVGAGVNWLLKKDKFKLGLHYYRGKRFQFENSDYSYVNASIQLML
jgi:hypothetical protein